MTCVSKSSRPTPRAEQVRSLARASVCRAIDPRPVEKDKLLSMLEAAQLSASCMNLQPWRFLVLDEADSLEKGRRGLADGNYWAKTAPVLVIGLSRAKAKVISLEPV